MSYALDPELRQYATALQWKRMEALAEYGSRRKAAEALGEHNHANISRAWRDIHRKAAKRGYAPAHGWDRPVPDGHKVRGVSTYYDKDGEVRGQWVKSAEDKERQAEMLAEWVSAFASELPKEEPRQMPEHGSKALMACYPVGDHHLGMLSWDEETGANYDMKIGERLLMGATNHLVGMAPACEKATIVFLGDFMHYDSFETVTPTSRNTLDADSRYPKMVRAAIRSMRYLIRRALSRHQNVRVVVEIGNHDLSSSIFLMECLHNVYEFEPRVTVDTSPAHYHYFTHGKTLVGIHHGHGTKMKDLPLIMAHDKPEEWGAARYRYWWTGHVHHDQTKDYHGTKVESFRTLAGNDAWAAQKGYRQMQDMKCVLLHDEYGEVSRHTVNPEMLK